MRLWAPANVAKGLQDFHPDATASFVGVAVGPATDGDGAMAEMVGRGDQLDLHKMATESTEPTEPTEGLLWSTKPTF